MAHHLIVILGAIFLTSCEGGPDRAIEVSKSLVLAFAEAQNNWDFDALNDIVAPDLLRHCQATPNVSVRSLDDVKHLAEEWQARWPTLLNAGRLAFVPDWTTPGCGDETYKIAFEHLALTALAVEYRCFDHSIINSPGVSTRGPTQ